MLAFIVRLKTRATVLAAFAALLTGGVAAASPVGPIPSFSSHQQSPASRGLPVRLNAAQATSAAQQCASYATAAGWANNGSLVTASAVCVAESGGRPAVYYCDATGQDGVYPPVSCPGIYDRGLWQLDSAGQPGTSDGCAFDAQCNADAAYTVSARGRTFAAWATYTNGSYADYIRAAQLAVDSLRTGTVPSAVLGACLASARYAQNAPVVIGACGTGARQQQWTAPGHTIRSGNLCVAVASPAAYARIRMRWCDGLNWQEWTRSGTGQLRNALSGQCLRDPGGSLVAGSRVTVAPCAASARQTWWLP
jgi:hypothetical protein